MKLRREKDFIVKKIELIAYNGNRYDITLLRQNLSIYQSIFTNFMSGFIVIEESVDLPLHFPIIGEEKIFVSFTRPEVDGDELETYKSEFRVYKMDDRKTIGERLQHYRLFFISEEYFRSETVKVQKSYRSKLWSEMADDCFKEFLSGRKEFFVEPTLYPQNFVAGNLTPIQFLNKIAAHSISGEGNGSGYLFYEDAKKFNLQSIGKMFEQEPIETYYKQPINVFEDGEGETWKPQPIETNIRTFEKYQWRHSFDILDNLREGMYASKTVAINPITKKVEIKEFDYVKDFSKFKHLEKAMPHTSSADFVSALNSVVNVVFSYSGLENDPDQLSNYIEDHLPFRQSQFRQIQNRMVQATVSGDPRVRVGTVVEFILPDQRGKTSPNEPQELDKYLQGKYLVVSAKQELLASQYNVQLELVKDTFASEIEHVNVIEEYRNIY